MAGRKHNYRFYLGMALEAAHLEDAVTFTHEGRAIEYFDIKNLMTIRVHAPSGYVWFELDSEGFTCELDPYGIQNASRIIRAGIRSKAEMNDTRKSVHYRRV